MRSSKKSKNDPNENFCLLTKLFQVYLGNNHTKIANTYLKKQNAKVCYKCKMILKYGTGTRI